MAEIELKDILLGVVTQVIPKTISHLAFIIMRNQGVPDADLRANPWYAEPVVGLPPVDDWITCVGIPLALFGGSRLTTGDRRKQLMAMGVGAGVAGGATFIHNIVAALPKTVLPPRA